MKAIASILFFACFCIAAKDALGQPPICCPYIDSVRVLPSNPTKNDIIRIALYVTTPSPAKTLSITQLVSGKDILISACYNSDNTAAQSDALADTIVLGNLPDGIYQLKVTTYYNLFFNNPFCDNAIDSTKLADSFIIHAPQNILPQIPDRLYIHPNPAQNELRIQLPGGVTIKRLEIKDAHGRRVKLDLSNSSVVDIGTLPPGLYFLYIQTDKGTLRQRFRKE